MFSISLDVEWMPPPSGPGAYPKEQYLDTTPTRPLYGPTWMLGRLSKAA